MKVLNKKKKENFKTLKKKRKEEFKIERAQERHVSLVNKLNINESGVHVDKRMLLLSAETFR